MVKAVILAGGKPSGFPRHLKRPFGKINRVIDNSIKACMRADLDIALVCDGSNGLLKKYVENKYPNVQILCPANDKMLSSFEVAFNHDEMCTNKLIVAGDLLKINVEALKTFKQYEDCDAISSLKVKFKKDMFLIAADPKIKIRTDIGTGIFLVSNTSQQLMLDPNFIQDAFELRNRFKGNVVDETTANDVWTWLVYLLFDQIYDHSFCKYPKSKQILLDLKIDTQTDYD